MRDFNVKTLAFAAICAGAAFAAPAHAQSAAPPAGQALFKAQCAICHTAAGNVNGVGPSLFGVTNRPIASVAGYNYSAGLKAYKGAWNKATLDTFLKTPTKVAPGTRMMMAVVDDTKRAAIIDYLATLK